jgi:hypothetical protein
MQDLKDSITELQLLQYNNPGQDYFDDFRMIINLAIELFNDTPLLEKINLMYEEGVSINHSVSIKTKHPLHRLTHILESLKQLDEIIPKEVAENYVGMLYDFCRKNNHPLPRYEFRSYDKKWFCTINQLSLTKSVGMTQMEAKQTSSQKYLQVIRECPIVDNVEWFIKNEMVKDQKYTCREIMDVLDKNGKTISKKQCNKRLYDFALRGVIKREFDIVVYWIKL